jgi:hypothetical protein
MRYESALSAKLEFLSHLGSSAANASLGPDGPEQSPSRIGVGIGHKGHGEFVVHIFTKSPKDDELLNAIAPIRKSRKGREVRVVRTGRLRTPLAHTATSGPGNTDQTGMIRPLRVGLSVGHQTVTAGTAGMFAKSTGGGSNSDVYLVSCTHVLADMKQMQDSGYPITENDVVLQPGRADSPDSHYPIGQLSAVGPIISGKSDNLDAATARISESKALPTNPAVLPGLSQKLSKVVLAEPQIAALGQQLVYKPSGRSSRSRTGKIVAVGISSVPVLYDSIGKRPIANAICVEGEGKDPFALRGDSGSICVTSTGDLIGLIFAVDTAARRAYLVPFHEVAARLSITPLT